MIGLRISVNAFQPPNQSSEYIAGKAALLDFFDSSASGERFAPASQYNRMDVCFFVRGGNGIDQFICQLAADRIEYPGDGFA